jgi:hypothetical protein
MTNTKFDTRIFAHLLEGDAGQVMRFPQMKHEMLAGLDTVISQDAVAQRDRRGSSATGSRYFVSLWLAWLPEKFN